MSSLSSSATSPVIAKANGASFCGAGTESIFISSLGEKLCDAVTKAWKESAAFFTI